MATLWTICGAGRGAGKTHLALGLCDALPNSVYAKQGCGQAKPGKPENFFRTERELASFVESCQDSYDHLVVESNAWARSGRGDIIIFLDRVSEQGNMRGDVEQLRSKSDIHVSPGADARRVLVEPDMCHLTHRLGAIAQSCDLGGGFKSVLAWHASWTTILRGTT